MIFTEARSLHSICGKEVSQEELELLDQSERAVEPEVELSHVTTVYISHTQCNVQLAEVPEPVELKSPDSPVKKKRSRCRITVKWLLSS